MNIHKTLNEAKSALTTITDQPALEAEILLAFVLNQPRSYLHARPETTLTEQEAQQFASLLERRKNKEPIAYLTGTKEFWSLSLNVTPDTLIPRPETELLVELILEITKDKGDNIKLADLGTGSGAIALALATEKPKWQILVTDISQDALNIARKNAQQLEIHHIHFYHGNWLTALPQPAGDFDVIVSNPPYIAQKEWESYAWGLAFEPVSALVSGVEGLDAIKEICYSAKPYLKPGAYLLIEHGFSQGMQVRSIFEINGYNEIRSVKDLAGRERVTMGKL